MMRRLLAAVFFLFSASVTQAYVDTGGRFTTGPDGYGGLNFFTEWGDDAYFLRPSLNTYKSDAADRYSAYSLSGGLDRPFWRCSAEVSITPETGGYKNSALFADLSFNLLGEPEEGAAFEDMSLGGFAGLTSHEDSYSLSTATVSSGPGRRTNVSTLTSSFKLKQTDYGLAASVRVYGVRLSGRFTKTSYDQDVTAEDRQLPINIGNIGASGFQDKAGACSPHSY